jgi:hypothetical protein
MLVEDPHRENWWLLGLENGRLCCHFLHICRLFLARKLALSFVFLQSKRRTPGAFSIQDVALLESWYPGPSFLDFTYTFFWCLYTGLDAQKIWNLFSVVALNQPIVAMQGMSVLCDLGWAMLIDVACPCRSVI